mmetsp:Transcript_8103/g.24036  ORF Transcript_8103/g.24036 Transcript_8103/m.24036 type:complete len:233 (+) Transcript_8103:536-1234(+)
MDGCSSGPRPGRGQGRPLGGRRGLRRPDRLLRRRGDPGPCQEHPAAGLLPGPEGLLHDLGVHRLGEHMRGRVSIRLVFLHRRVVAGPRRARFPATEGRCGRQVFQERLGAAGGQRDALDVGRLPIAARRHLGTGRARRPRAGGLPVVGGGVRVLHVLPLLQGVPGEPPVERGGVDAPQGACGFHSFPRHPGLGLHHLRCHRSRFIRSAHQGVQPGGAGGPHDLPDHAGPPFR